MDEKLRAAIAAAQEVMYCVEINDTEINRVQLRGYSKPVLVTGWTATKISAFIDALLALEDAGGVDAALRAARAQGRAEAMKEADAAWAAKIYHGVRVRAFEEAAQAAEARATGVPLTVIGTPEDVQQAELMADFAELVALDIAAAIRALT